MLTPLSRLALALVFALVFPSVSRALEVKETRWGFDGRVVEDKFNILSVLVAQPGAKAFEGQLELTESRGFDNESGAPLAQPLYLAPGTQRWVQFVVLIPNETEWRLSWGRSADQRADVSHASLAPPASVLLVDSSSIFTTESRLKGFAEDLFPTSVAATDALDQVVLDHAPRWDAPRREAFLDWLKRGGIVHLVRGPAGLPVFSDSLAPLNTTLPRERVGAGMVVRHDIPASECSDQFLAKAGFPVREFREKETTYQYTGLWNFEQTLLTKLASLTKPEVAWWLLYLLTIAYLVIIGPVHYRWARKIDYRIAIAGFLATVVVFAIAFVIAGHRGNGEVQISHAVAIARALPDKRWDVTQWVSAFATSGDYYKLSYDGPSSYFSTAGGSESVRGKIVGGKDGFFDVDIPLYSSRPFISRGVLSGPEFQPQVETWDGNQISLRVGKSFPTNAREIYVQRGTRFTVMQLKGEVLVNRGESFDYEMFFTSSEMNQHSGGDWTKKDFESPGVAKPLMALFDGDVTGLQNRVVHRELANDQARLFVFAEAPDGFAMKGKNFSRHKGWTLFIQDVFKAP